MALSLLLYWMLIIIPFVDCMQIGTYVEKMFQSELSGNVIGIYVQESMFDRSMLYRYG